MSKQEIEIVARLSSASAEPRPEFKQQLLNKILATEEPKTERNIFMSNLRVITAASFVLLAIVGFSAFTMMKSDEPQQIVDSGKQVVDSGKLPVNDSDNTSLATSLPVNSIESFEDAKAAVDFPLYQPSIKIGDESISTIEKIDSFLGDGQDSIAIKYADADGTLYRVNQSKFIGAPPEEAEDVEISFLGNKYTAQFAQIMTLGEENENSESFVYGDSSIPSSYLSWEAEGVGYEISEFGRVSMEQLVQLAESMK